MGVAVGRKKTSQPVEHTFVVFALLKTGMASPSG